MRLCDAAAACGVSESTVIRFAHALGYARFAAFRADFAGVGAAKRDRKTLKDDAARAADMALAAVKGAENALGTDALEAAVRAILAAGRIAVVGDGCAFVAAKALAWRLSSVGCGASLCADPPGQYAVAALLGKGDVLVVFSASGAFRSSVAAARIAQKNGARVIGVTHSAGSPVAAEADIALCVADAAPADDADALIALVTAADFLYMGVYAALPQKKRDKLMAYRSLKIDRTF